MADVAKARETAKKITALLVNRFGAESDVFALLSELMSYLREDPPKKAAPKIDVIEAIDVVIEGAPEPPADALAFETTSSSHVEVTKPALAKKKAPEK